MKSKRCSHNLQSNHRGNSQRFFKMLMSRFINLRRLPRQKELNRLRNANENVTRNFLLQRIYNDRIQVKIEKENYTAVSTFSIKLYLIYLFHVVVLQRYQNVKSTKHVLQVIVLQIRTYCSTLHSRCPHWTNYSGKFSRLS